MLFPFHSCERKYVGLDVQQDFYIFFLQFRKLAEKYSLPLRATGNFVVVIVVLKELHIYLRLA